MGSRRHEVWSAARQSHLLRRAVGRALRPFVGGGRTGVRQRGVVATHATGHGASMETVVTLAGTTWTMGTADVVGAAQSYHGETITVAAGSPGLLTLPDGSTHRLEPGKQTTATVGQTGAVTVQAGATLSIAFSVVSPPAAEHDWSDISIVGGILTDHGTAGGADGELLSSSGADLYSRAPNGPGLLAAMVEAEPGGAWIQRVAFPSGSVGDPGMPQLWPPTFPSLTAVTWVRVLEPAADSVTSYLVHYSGNGTVDAFTTDNASMMLQAFFPGTNAQMLCRMRAIDQAAGFSHQAEFTAAFPADAAWHMIACEYDRDARSWTLRIDGIVAGQCTVPDVVDSNPALFYTATSGVGEEGHWRQLEDQGMQWAGMRVYHRVLSDAERAELLLEGGVS